MGTLHCTKKKPTMKCITVNKMENIPNERAISSGHCCMTYTGGLIL